MKLRLTVLPCTLHTRFPPPSPFPSLSPNAAPSRRRCTAFSSQRKPLLRCHIFCWRQDRAIGGAETSIDALAVLLRRESPGGGNGAHRACWNMCLSLQSVLWQFRFVAGDGDGGRGRAPPPRCGEISSSTPVNERRVWKKYGMESPSLDTMRPHNPTVNKIGVTCTT